MHRDPMTGRVFAKPRFDSRMLASEAARVSEGGAPGARCRRGEPPHERKGGARHNPRTKSEPVRGPDPGFRQLGIEVDVKNAHNTIMSHMGMHGAKRAPPPPRAGVLAIRRQIARLLLRPTAQPRCHPGGLRVGRGGSPRAARLQPSDPRGGRSGHQASCSDSRNSRPNSKRPARVRPRSNAIRLVWWPRGLAGRIDAGMSAARVPAWARA